MPGFALPPPPPPSKVKVKPPAQAPQEPTAADSAPAEEAGAAASHKTTVFALQGVTLEIQARQLVVICGVVGSGKSSLLEAILGEMVTVAGSIQVHGSYAYAAQVPCPPRLPRTNLQVGVRVLTPPGG
jgi:ABC-type transport system involved in cytochrome bd biosynthesis fused ATPase/permease subunit